ncbi:MAG: hypothetical protein QOG64_983, partial [Acidimicrobiaceae bacterium]|nr:hypothetical protein [Acidimicrobiaceae bacterium]
MELPRIISVDDHVLEPADLWTSRLPAKLRDAAPHVRREKGGFRTGAWDPNANNWVVDPEMPGAVWSDVWYYDDMVWPLMRGLVDCGYTDEDPGTPVTYDRALLGTYDPVARIAD